MAWRKYATWSCRTCDSQRQRTGFDYLKKGSCARAESGPTDDDPSGCKRGQLVGLGVSSGARSPKNNATVPSNEKLRLLLRIGCSQNIK